jgi:hypothetical protein
VDVRAGESLVRALPLGLKPLPAASPLLELRFPSPP